MTARNVDIEPTGSYEFIQNEAANKYVATTGYDGNADGLARKQAFVLGANTSPYDLAEILKAVLAGRIWGLEEPS